MFNDFELIDDFESMMNMISSSDCEDTDDSIESDLAIDFGKCLQCNIPMLVKTNNHYVCSNCGLIRDDLEAGDMSSAISDMNYNTVSNGLRCIGNNAYRYQTILRSQSANEASPELHVRNILFTYNHKIGKEGAIPKYILLNVCEQYKLSRRAGTIYRGTILRAILAAMTYYECIRQKLMFKPSDIYNWFEVDSQTYSKGDKKVREMLDHGFLSEDIRLLKVENNYLQAYADKMDLPDGHASLLCEIMDFIAENNLLNPNAKSSTRALCVLHIYIVATKYPMKSDVFRKMFKCNYGTIRTIAMESFNAIDRIIPIFEKHNVSSIGLSVSTRIKRVARTSRLKVSRIELTD